MTTIAAQIAALQSMPLDELCDEYTRLHDRPPFLRRRPWLTKRIAWAIQAREFGGLSDEAQERLDVLIAEIDVPLAGEPTVKRVRLNGRHRRDGLAVGSTITRDYKGREILVRIVENGFEWEGVLYGSLSAVARAITGSHWNGRLFFRLTKRRAKS